MCSVYFAVCCHVLAQNTGCLPILESVTLKLNFSVIFEPMKLSLGWDEYIDFENGPN